MGEITLKGKVVEDSFAEGSKSAHTAVFLDTGKEQYRLKMKDGNPFYDESLRKLLGKTISATGILNDYFFEIAGDPEIIKPSKKIK